MKNNVKMMNNKELLDNTIHLVKKERMYGSLILKNIEEIDRRKIYGELGYGSIFEYLVKELKYS